LSDLLLYSLAGFLAQMIDGMLGMGYGVSATSILLTMGVPAAVSSASVHTAEAVVTGFSAYSHYRFGNVVWAIARRLLIPGIIGAVIGAYILSSIPGDRIKPFISAYLLVMGLLILRKGLRGPGAPKPVQMEALGLAGGFFDAIGGGGWGPIVVGSMLARGNEPRTTIGSVNFAEFFVTVAASVTFLLTLGVSSWRPVAGLAIGGAIAAPIAAKLVHRVPARPLMVMVALLVIALSLRTLLVS
jgi:uncharacterized protein